jgi:phosphotransferase system enzyme I (PtsI)
MEILHGIPVSTGIAIGPIQIITQDEHIIREIHLDEPEKIKREIQLFRTALKRTKADLMSVKRDLQKHLGREEAKIFDAHLHILADIAVINKTINTIKKEKRNAAFAFKTTVEETLSVFQSVKDKYLKERAVDIKDVYHRLLNHLLEDSAEGTVSIAVQEKFILGGHSIAPYEFIHFKVGNIFGIVSEVGGRTSHFSIIAKSLDIPAVVGCENLLLKAKSGDTVIIDGNRGLVIISPDASTLKKYEKAKARYLSREQQLLALKDLDPVTIDGKVIDIAANIELPSEINTVLEHGCRNIGLCRTEFLYLLKNKPPSEEEQYGIYKNYLKKMYPGYVIIRTLDLGGDKIASYTQSDETEANPSLGWRAIRICLEEEDLFRTQLRAILRASAHGQLKVMFPMISSVEELRKTLRFYRQVKKSMIEENIEINPNIEVGIMIEVPSAALCADTLAREVDFFSIGTNDLIQFTLAVDRGNEKIASMYDPHHPGVLKIIKQAIDAGHAHNRWVGVCGEMASNPLSALMLLGMGVDELSMNSLSVLEIKKVVRSITFDEMRTIVEEALTLDTSKKISLFLQKEFKKKIHLSHKFNF